MGVYLRLTPVWDHRLSHLRRLFCFSSWKSFGQRRNLNPPCRRVTALLSCPQRTPLWITGFSHLPSWFPKDLKAFAPEDDEGKSSGLLGVSLQLHLPDCSTDHRLSRLSDRWQQERRETSTCLQSSQGRVVGLDCRDSGLVGRRRPNSLIVRFSRSLAADEESSVPRRAGALALGRDERIFHLRSVDSLAMVLIASHSVTWCVELHEKCAG